MEQAAFFVPEGGISDVIESSFGHHILKVDERQEAGGADLDDVRKDIQPRLRAMAAAELYKTWIQELRKESRVRIFY